MWVAESDPSGSISRRPHLESHIHFSCSHKTQSTSAWRVLASALARALLGGVPSLPCTHTQSLQGTKDQIQPGCSRELQRWASWGAAQSSVSSCRELPQGLAHALSPETPPWPRIPDAMSMLKIGLGSVNRSDEVRLEAATCHPLPTTEGSFCMTSSGAPQGWSTASGLSSRGQDSHSSQDRLTYTWLSVTRIPCDRAVLGTKASVSP